MIVVVGIPLWAYLSFKSYKRKLRRVYDEIKIGDRYKFEMPPLHPFDESHVYKATIIGKTLARGKSPWVQYRYDDMLYPQYENRFAKTITKGLMESLIEEAKKHIAEHESNPKSMVHPEVLAHWKKIAQGIPPFGYKVVDEKF